MRITTNLLFNTTLAHIQQHNARLLQTSEEASSGLRLQRPSDDPAGTRRVLDLRHTLSSLDQFKSQHVVVNSLLDGTDTALQDTATLLLSAKGLALRAASDTVSAEQRSAIAHEVGACLRRLSPSVIAWCMVATCLPGKPMINRLSRCTPRWPVRCAV